MKSERVYLYLIIYFFRETRSTNHVHDGILLSIDFYLRFLPTIKVSTFTYELTFKLLRFTQSFSSYRGSKRFIFQANAFNVLKLIYDSLARKMWFIAKE